MTKYFMCFLFVIMVASNLNATPTNTTKLPEDDLRLYCINEDGTWYIELTFRDHIILLHSTGFYERIEREID